uniref:Hpc2-related domain-containing protein n=1 Tax=Peronospora matthiolae TaxID=2874970 RepID=A0AAV1TKU2_9STRA
MATHDAHEMASASTSTTQRQTFYIQLDNNAPAEINFKQLVIQHSRPFEALPSSTSPANTASTAVPLPKNSESVASTTRPQRFNIIEHLEKRYGSGSVLQDGYEGGDGFDRRDDDDLYDSEDSFIDDAELQQHIEDVRDHRKVKTKHAGFFVNAGEEIETLEQEEDEDDESKQGKKRTVSGALRSFLEELPEGVSEWQPDEEVVKRLEVLRTAVQELAETAPIPKVFPRSLDGPLRAVDKLVVEAHPNKWRVTGYFATLMTFLPYTKQYLKSNMLRLEARDVAKNEREKLDSAVETLTEFVVAYGSRAAAEPVDAVMADIAKDKELGTKLHTVLEFQDDWVAKENDYRQMLKTEDKKHMKEPDYKPLNHRQERNRMFNRVLALFPSGLTDLQTLRALNKAAKAKVPKKPAQPKTLVKGAVATTKKKSAEQTTGATASVKRSIKPFKSRMMDEAPPFIEEDFEEIEQ